MAIQGKSRFSRRIADHVTDELINVLSGDEIYGFNDLFLKVLAGLKLKNAVSGGEEMLRLRCYEKLQYLTNRGFVLKSGKTYRGQKGLEQASSAHKIARADAAIAARAAAVAAATAS